MYLSSLKPSKGSNKGSKKVGRGNGNGHGKTACRGSNGANSRSGAKHRAWFEGGQLPIQRRLPKRGFYNRFKIEYSVVNVCDLEKKLGNADVVDTAILLKRGLIKSATKPVKILGVGDLKKAFTIKANAFSKIAIEKVENAGGKTELIK